MRIAAPARSLGLLVAAAAACYQTPAAPEQATEAGSDDAGTDGTVTTTETSPGTTITASASDPTASSTSPGTDDTLDPDTGDLDLLAVSTALGGVAVYVNDGTGTFAEPIALTVDGPAYNVAVDDLDGDGALDVVVPYDTPEGGRVAVFLASP